MQMQKHAGLKKHLGYASEVNSFISSMELLRRKRRRSSHHRTSTRTSTSTSTSSSTSSNSRLAVAGSVVVVLMILFAAAAAAAPAPAPAARGFRTASSVNATLSSRPLIPAVFAFGDSIVDPGNNDVLLTSIRCDFPPYGQDFIDHVATGRFSNGLIPTDLIASGLGIKQLLPPYLGVDLSPEDILTGVSFASGATGYDPLTPQVVSVIPMPDELKMFAEYKEKLVAIAGVEKSEQILSQALFIICAGTDDVANTYFTTPFRRLHYDIPSYVELLISSASDFIKQLYNMGARKIGFVGLPPIGCLPSQRTLGGGLLRECEDTRNEAAQLFNTRIQIEIQKISTELSQGGKVYYINIFDILLDLIQRPEYYGFKVSTKGCCGTGEIEVTLLCNAKTASVCDDVTEYVFWDSYHPTEKAYRILVDYIFDNYLNMIL